jgi:hypothetical protein
MHIALVAASIKALHLTKSQATEESLPTITFRTAAIEGYLTFCFEVMDYVLGVLNSTRY